MSIDILKVQWATSLHRLCLSLFLRAKWPMRLSFNRTISTSYDMHENADKCQKWYRISATIRCCVPIDWVVCNFFFATEKQMWTNLFISMILYWRHTVRATRKHVSQLQNYPETSSFDQIHSRNWPRFFIIFVSKHDTKNSNGKCVHLKRIEWQACLKRYFAYKIDSIYTAYLHNLSVDRIRYDWCYILLCFLSE